MDPQSAASCGPDRHVGARLILGRLRVDDFLERHDVMLHEIGDD
jgi:hypothetical protein